jgi:EmrB/QacA subfamily drug resistance transporter
MASTRLVPIILAVAMFIENLDSTVISTSLAAIAADIGSEPIALKLALTSYLVALAIFIPISSWAADKYGSRNVFRWALVVFLCGSLLCAISANLAMFVGSRFIQGMGGAMMTPVARLILVRTTPRHQLVDAMAWLSIPGLVGPIVGPPVGGFITTYFSWHWIFLINVPIGIIGVAMVTKYLPDFHRNEPRKMDFLGFVLAGTTFAGWVFGISVLTLPALPASVGISALVAGTVAAGIYLWHFRRVEYPLLDLRLFRFPLFRMSIVAGSIYRLGTGAIPFLFPLMLQLSFGLTPFESGSVTFATAAGAFGAKFIAEWFIQRWGFRGNLVAATAISSLGVIAMGLFTPDTPMWLIMTLLCITGFFQSMFWTATNAFVFADIEDKDAGQANVMSQVALQLSIAFGVALGGGVLDGVRHLHGGEPLLGDFHVSFYVIGGVALLSSIMFLALPKGAGAHLAERHPRAPVTAVEKPAE